MKYLALIIVATFGLAPMAVAMDDDFGAPFTDQAPAGFEDGSADDGSIGIENISPELIEPAAGDYFDSEEQGVDGDDAQNTADQPQEPDTEISL